MGFKTRPSSVEVLPLKEIRERLRNRDLPKRISDFLTGSHVLDEEHWNDGDVGLWLDGPFDTVVKEVPNLSPHLAIVVFAFPVSTKESIILRTIDLFNWFLARDGSIYLFLHPVEARDLCSAPDVLALFASGLKVERVACFDGGDSGAVVAGEIIAPYLFSNHRGSGGLTVSPGTRVDIGEYSRYIYDLPKGTGAIKHDDVEEMWPNADFEQIDDEDAWGYVIDCIDEGRPLPP